MPLPQWPVDDLRGELERLAVNPDALNQWQRFKRTSEVQAALDARMHERAPECATARDLAQGDR